MLYSVYLGRDTSEFPDTWTPGIEFTAENDEMALTPQIRKGLTKTGALAASFGVQVPLGTSTSESNEVFSTSAISSGNTASRSSPRADRVLSRRGRAERHSGFHVISARRRHHRGHHDEGGGRAAAARHDRSRSVRFGA